MNGIKGIKACFIFAIAIMGILLWNKISSCILYSLMTHQATSAPTFLYLSMLYQLHAMVSVQKYLVISGISTTGLMAIPLFFLIKETVPDIYGKARFANQQDLKKAGLLNNQGIILGRAFSREIRLSGYEHVTVFAPTGTGKTTGVTVPNLLDWPESAVVSDIKLELFKLTSNYRQSQGQKVFLWSLGTHDGITHCYNPLDMIDDNPFTRVDEIQKIAEIFIPNNPKADTVWEPQARMLFVALALYVLDTPTYPRTIASIIKLFKSQPNFTDFIQYTLATRQNLDPVCRENLMKLGELSHQTRTSVTFTFSARFELFDNPLIVAATSRSDFDIRKLRKEKMTIYVGVTNDNLVRLSPLLTIFYQQVADAMTRKIPGVDEPHGVLLLMDEFSALRRMDSFQKNIGLYREYRLRIVLIIQELSQLYEIYGRDGAKVFINSKIRIAYTQNDDETCKLLELMLGTKTIVIKNKSKNIRGMMDEGRSESVQYTARSLMLAQEIRWMPENKALIIVQGYPAIYADKIAWYKQLPFKNRMLGPIAIPSILSDIPQLLGAYQKIATNNELIRNHPPSNQNDETEELDSVL